jgi:molecular chaperone GrpE (heat shock protein)
MKLKRQVTRWRKKKEKITMSEKPAADVPSATTAAEIDNADTSISAETFEPVEPPADHNEVSMMDEEPAPDSGQDTEAGSGFLSPAQLKSLLELSRTAAPSIGSGDGRLGERLARIESLLDQFVVEGRERDRRFEESNRAMRAYFTDELGRLREAITQELRVRASQKLLQEVLPILNDMDDLLARGNEAAQDEQTARLWRALEAYRRRFYNGLRRLGLEEITVVEGETLFDPYIHECVSAVAEEPVETGEEMHPGALIIGVRRRGYLFQNELFQPPQVIIRGGE